MTISPVPYCLTLQIFWDICAAVINVTSPAVQFTGSEAGIVPLLSSTTYSIYTNYINVVD